MDEDQDSNEEAASRSADTHSSILSATHRWEAIISLAPTPLTPFLEPAGELLSPLSSPSLTF